MSVQGSLAVARVEGVKLVARRTTHAVLTACVVGPFIFAGAMRVQPTVPEDTLFGRSVRETGYAVPLVVLGFSAFWLFPALASLVGGVLFASEDRHGTWAALLTRSRSRGEVFTGKILMAMTGSTVVVAVLAASSFGAGLLVIGHQPIVDLSGALVSPGQAFARIALSWATVLPGVFAFTALAVVASLATRSTAAGIGLPVIGGLLMQLLAYIDGRAIFRRLLLTTSFEAWHGLLVERPYYRPLAYGATTSGLYALVCLILASWIVKKRDFDA